VRLKSPGSDFRSSWMQEPDAGSSELPELVQGGRTRGARGDARLSRQAEVLGGAAAARQREERLFARGRFRMAR
jgi:hypothetical protein